MKKIKIYLILILSIIIFSFYSYGCINKVNKHKTFLNMIISYYPEYNIEIVKSDPNSLIVHITK